MNRKFKLSPFHILCALAALVIGIFWIALEYHLSSSRGLAIKEAKQSAYNLAQVLEEHTANSIKSIDILLMSINALISGPELHELHTPDVQAFLQHFLNYNWPGYLWMKMTMIRYDSLTPLSREYER